MIPLSQEFREGLADPAVAKTLLAAITQPDGVSHLWTGAGSVLWQGEEYLGLGDLCDVSEIVDDDQVAVSDLVFTLSGVDPAQLQLLQSNVKGQTARLWFALVRRDLTIIPSPVALRVARLDVMTQKIETSLSATITVVSQADLWKSDQPNRAAFTTQEQQSLGYGDDTGFDLIGTSSTGSWRRT